MAHAVLRRVQQVREADDAGIECRGLAGRERCDLLVSSGTLGLHVRAIGHAFATSTSASVGLDRADESDESLYAALPFAP